MLEQDTDTHCESCVCVRLPVLGLPGGGAHDVTVMSRRVLTSMCERRDVGQALSLSLSLEVPTLPRCDSAPRSPSQPDRFGCISEQSRRLIGRRLWQAQAGEAEGQRRSDWISQSAVKLVKAGGAGS